MSKKVYQNRKLVLMVLVLTFSLTLFCSMVEANKTHIVSDTVQSGLEDQTGVALTVYNVNLGLVKDIREIKLGTGISQLRFMDVASQIIPMRSVLRSL